MQAINFERLRVRLLKGGIAPKYVRRNLLELRNHFEELVDQKQAEGLSESQARSSAIEMLGDEDKLVAEAKSKRELLSWSRRYSKSVYLCLPLASYFILAFGIGYLWLDAILELFGINYESNWPRWHYQLSTILLFLYEYLFAPTIAAVVALIAVRRNMNMLWPLAGIALVCFFATGLETIIELPNESRRGGVMLMWGWPFLPWESARPTWPQSIEQFIRWIVAMGIAVLIFKIYQPYKTNSKAQ